MRMIPKLNKAELVQKYKKMIEPVRSIQEVLKLMEKYDISEIDYDDMDEISRDTNSSFKGGKTYKIEKNQNSLRFFEEVRNIYGENVGVYIFLQNEDLFSNSGKLELELNLLKGISEQDVISETPEYFHYLYRLHLKSCEGGFKYEEKNY